MLASKMTGVVGGQGCSCQYAQVVSLSSQIHSMSSLVWRESNGPLADLPPHQLLLALPDSLKPAGSGVSDDHLVWKADDVLCSLH